jgi:hypothetical protein
MSGQVRLTIPILLVAALASCSTPPGNALTDRQAAQVARRLSSPRQRSADGLLRAAVGTNGADPNLQVVEAEDLPAKEIEDALARLVFSHPHRRQLLRGDLRRHARTGDGLL